MNYFNRLHEAKTLAEEWKDYDNYRRPQIAPGKLSPSELADRFGSSGSALLHSATPPDRKQGAASQNKLKRKKPPKNGSKIRGLDSVLWSSTKGYNQLSQERSLSGR